MQLVGEAVDIVAKLLSLLNVIFGAGSERDKSHEPKQGIVAPAVPIKRKWKPELEARRSSQGRSKGKLGSHFEKKE